MPEKRLVSPPASFRLRIREFIDRVTRKSPARLTLGSFGAAILLFTALLMLPISSRSGKVTPFIDALFTATSAVCVTGLTVVDTATFWSPIGHFFLAIAMMIGGLGIMVLTAILALTVSRHIGFTQRILAASATQSRLGEVSSLLRVVLIVALSAQGILFLLLTPFFIRHGDVLLSALGHAVFTSISIFNNVGFFILPEGIPPFSGDLSLMLPIMLGTIVGAIGFPVILDISQQRTKISKWSLTTKLTVITHIVLILAGAIFFFLFEFHNPKTLAYLDTGDQISSSLLHSITARTSGLNTINISDMSESTLLMIDGLMFIGGGSTSAAGGIKVTTFAVLILAIVAEAKGTKDTEVFGRSLPPEVLRLAIAVTLLGSFLVGTGTIALMETGNISLSQALFESISAFATCGLSTGVTSSLPEQAKFVVILLMYAGRTGTMTLAAALTLRSRTRLIRYPEEIPQIG